MFKKYTIFGVIFLNVMLLNGLSAHSIVFIHIGTPLPDYFFDALDQALLFNDCPVYLIANKHAIAKSKCSKIKNQNFHTIEIESLVQSKSHSTYLANSSLLKKHDTHFWLYASERFFYLDEFMEEYNIEDVYHLEYDNMLYVDLSHLLPIFKNNYSGIAAIFDNDNRCIPGFVYVANKNVMHKLADYFSVKAAQGLNDMELIADFKNHNSFIVIDGLPIIMNDYIAEYGLKSPHGHTTRRPPAYCNKIDLFNSIFDAAALGQFLGGIHTDPVPGFINETCLFNPSLLTYEWIKDGQGRLVPFALFKDTKYRINNLHIHSKQLKKFSSIK